MFVTRFAPSPTGNLHLGHAFSALTAFEAARSAHGRFLLRIEDTDHGRCRAEFESAIYEDLAWLGLEWETPVRRQSEHMDDYRASLESLMSKALLYRCFRTRQEILNDIANAPHELSAAVRSGPLAPADEAECLAAGRPFAWRLSLDRCRDFLGRSWDALGFEADGVWVKAQPTQLGDAILARKEFPASYHLASVHDDALQGVDHVIRGVDLAEAAHLHALLYALLDRPTPRYRHHRLILGADGKRLAKRDQSASLRALRLAGRTPAEVRAMLAP